MNITDLLDTTTLIISVAVILLAVIVPFCSPFFRLKFRDDEEKDAQPPVSIILTPHDNADLIEKHLPALLYQKYEPGYEVIVVVEQGDHETENALKRIDHAYRSQPQNATLYITHIPDSSRYMSRKKLAITIGVKAANHEWLLLTEPYSVPSSDQWLATMARNCDADKNLVIGYTRYNDDTSTFKRFERFHTAAYLMREDVKATAFRTDGTNLMFRKSEFMEQDGYLGNLELVRGEYDFLVNKYAREGATALEIDPQAWMTEDQPSRKTWMLKHVFYIETKKHLLRATKHNVTFIADTVAAAVYALAFLSAAVYALITMNIVVATASAISIIVRLSLDYHFTHQAIRAFGENMMSGLWFYYERLIPWNRLYYRIKHRLADEMDFSTHKQ